MAEWKKIIVSGSQAELAGVTGSFTGSFFGDGSGLTGLSSFSVSGDTNDRVITADGAGGGVGEPNLTFDGSTLGISGTINASSTITGSGLQLTSVPAGTDNTVLVLNAAGGVVTDEIDPRVWGTTLVDAANGADNRIATFSDADSLNGEANLTFDGLTLNVAGTINASSTITNTLTGSSLQLTSVGAGTDNSVLVLDTAGNVVTDEIDARVWGSTLVDGSGLAAGYITFASDSDTITGASDFTYTSGTKTLSVTNATITGNLIVQGTTTELQVTNLNVEDQFILLNSGSSGADTGIIFGGIGGTPNQGVALYFDNNDTRLSVASGIAANATSATTEGYITIAYDVDTAGHTPVTAVGNIKIEGGEPFIYA